MPTLPTKFWISNLNFGYLRFKPKTFLQKLPLLIQLLPQSLLSRHVSLCSGLPHEFPVLFCEPGFGVVIDSSLSNQEKPATTAMPMPVSRNAGGGNGFCAASLLQQGRRDKFGNCSRSKRLKLPISISVSHKGDDEDLEGLDALTNTKKKKKKRVMVVVDASPEAKIAMIWALSNLIDKLDKLILLHICINSNTRGTTTTSSCRHFHLTSFLKSLCKARRPEVEVEAEMVVMEEVGRKGAAVVKAAKRLEASVLVLGQRRPSLIHRLIGKKKDAELVEYCINNAECLTLGVSKQSSSIGGYLINSKYHKNFWLLA